MSCGIDGGKVFDYFRRELVTQARQLLSAPLLAARPDVGGGGEEPLAQTQTPNWQHNEQTTKMGTSLLTESTLSQNVNTSQYSTLNSYSSNQNNNSITFSSPKPLQNTQTNSTAKFRPTSTLNPH